MPEVAASQSVPLVLPHLAGRGEQAHVGPDEEIVFEIIINRVVNRDQRRRETNKTRYRTSAHVFY